MKKVLFTLMALVMVLGTFLPALPAAATVHEYSIEILTINGAPISNPPASITTPVSIAGDCWATSFVGQLSQYGVQVDWGDGSVGNITPNLTEAGDNFSGTWGPVSHPYFPSGTFTIIVTLYHQLYQGAERSPDATFTMTLTVTTAGSNSPVCQGSTIQLTAGPNGMSSYAWTGPNGFTSNVQNPIIPNSTLPMSGIYNLIVTSTTSATDNSATTVIVNPLPDSTITTPSAVCAESTGHTASVPDAGPSASYSWSVTGQGMLTGVSDARTIAWNALGAGTTTISVTVTSGFGCTSTATTNVVVNPKPVATASSNSPVCEGSTIVLTGGPDGMSSYAWSGPKGPISNLQSFTIPDATTEMSGTYTLTVTSSSGCTGTSATTTVVVNPKPVATASSNSPVCEGSTIVLSGGPDGMSSYAWSGPNGPISNLQGFTIPDATTDMSGTYTLTVTNAYGCTFTATTDVTVNALPDSTITTPPSVCAESTGNIAEVPDAGPGASYNWSVTGKGTLTGVNGTRIIAWHALDQGTATISVSITNAYGCTIRNTTNVMVNAELIAIASSNSPCEGGTISLTGEPGGMSSYLWTGPDYFSSGLQNPTIPNATSINAGTYTLKVTNTSGCIATVSTEVVVNPAPEATASSNSPCEGGTISLTGGPDGMASYAWIGPNGPIGSLQSLTIPDAKTEMSGIYTLTVTSSKGCTGTATTTVVVNPLPDSNITTPSSVCARSAHTASVPDGGPGALYSWSVTGQGILSGVNYTRTIAWNALDEGEATISVSITTSFGCTIGNTTNVVVNAKPIATAGSNTPLLCQGGTISLTGGPDGMTYAWSGPNVFTSALQNPTIPNATGNMTGTYILIVTNATGCADTATTTVVVNDKPVAVASSNSPVCQGGTIALSGGPDGMTYTWTGPDGFTSALQNPTIPNATGNMTGTYTLNVTSVLGCTGTAATTAVVVNPKPVAVASSNSPVYETTTIHLTGGPDGMASYAWTGPNGFTSALQNPTIPDVIKEAAGTYCLTVTSFDGCTDFTTTDVEINPKPMVTADSNSPVCQDSTISLFGGPSGAVSYLWLGPNGFISALQNPTIPDATGNMTGPYFLTVTFPFSFSVITMTTVVVTAKPVATASSNSPVCEGGTISLTGGPNGMASYAWTGPDSFTSALQNPTIPNATGNMAGTYTLNVTSALGCTGIAGNTTVVVNAKPLAVASSNSPVYETTTISLSGGPDGMESYLWDGPNSYTSNVQNPTIPNATTNMSGTYTLIATNSSGCTVTITTNVTVLQLPIPSAPTLLSPGNGAYAAGTSITCTWNASTWANNYRLTVSTSSNPSDPSKFKFNATVGNVTQYIDTGYSNNGTTYYWWVSAGNSRGWAAQSEVNANGFRFINWPPPPSAPALVGPGTPPAGGQSPGNATYVPGTSITYQWNASADATVYSLIVSTSSNSADTSKRKFSNYVGNVTQYTDTGYPDNRTTYYWWVNACNIAGCAPSSQWMENGLSFINGTQLPSAPTLVSPGQGTVVSGTSITYQWNASAGATVYSLIVSTSSNSADTSKLKFSNYVGNVTQFTDTNYPDNGTTYYWWVNVCNSGGCAPSSEWVPNGFSFVNYTPPPSPPTLVYPGNGTMVSGTSITYRWNASLGATNYWLTVSTSSNSSDTTKRKFSTMVGNVTQFTDTNYPDNGTTYYWWVNAGNSGGWAPSSQWMANGCSFANGVLVTPPLAPTLVYPGNGASVSGTSITYQWNASAGATVYSLIVSTSSNSADTSKRKFANYVGNVTQFTDTGYPNNGATYYWWVNACNTAGCAPSSQWIANGFWLINRP